LASNQEISAFVQYIRNQVSVTGIPSLTPMSVFQANVKGLASLLWFHCDVNPSSCGLSRLGSVRIVQWRRSSLSDAACFSSPVFVRNCIGSQANVPGAASPQLLHFAHGNSTVDESGKITVTLNSDAADESLWEDLFAPSSAFFTAETARLEVEATLFSPKLQHFVSFRIAAILDGGSSHSR
jgi:hypothetical protein